GPGDRLAPDLDALDGQLLRQQADPDDGGSPARGDRQPADQHHPAGPPRHLSQATRPHARAGADGSRPHGRVRPRLHGRSVLSDGLGRHARGRVDGPACRAHDQSRRHACCLRCGDGQCREADGPRWLRARARLPRRLRRPAGARPDRGDPPAGAAAAGRAPRQGDRREPGAEGAAASGGSSRDHGFHTRRRVSLSISCGICRFPHVACGPACSSNIHPQALECLAFPARRACAASGASGKHMAHIRLNTHPSQGGQAAPAVSWGARDPKARGPVVGTVADPARRNAIGVHSGSYGIYRALAIAAQELKPGHRPDFTNTTPAEPIGPFESWFDPKKIVSLDPWGHLVSEVFADKLAAGWDIRPTIAVTKAHVNMPEIKDAIAAGRLKPDNDLLTPNGDVRVTKAAVEPVWWLPGIAERFGVKETDLRRTLFEHTGGMYTELVTRSDLELFLPPIGGSTIYFFGDVTKLGKPETKIACRLHDECNGSDVFGSDICTCRPYLTHGIEICIEMAQKGGVGDVIYNRKEGRALGEVTKFLVYNARKRQPGGDSAAQYFNRTECVAGVQDMRFQELMPDIFHWLGIARIDRFASMSNLKSDALREQGIDIVEQVAIPDELIPADAQVEMDAKRAAGYFTIKKPEELELVKPKGRGLME